MGECKIDHTLEDVRQKWQDQMDYLPEDIRQGLDRFLIPNRSQETLNEVFHLLKKYDLAEPDERQNRDAKLKELLGNS
jgi:hypothetical protein